MAARIEDAIAALAGGEMIILVDDEHRENEGDLCMLAEKVSPESINFMAKYGRGLICVTITQEKAESLELPPMVNENTSRFRTGFTISIEAAQGVSTGISAADRAHTIRVASSPDARPSDLARPGHVFPIIARPGGVLVRVGQTEGSVDLARLAGAKTHAGVICEIMNEDGSMARMPDLVEFAKKHNLLIVTIADLVAYRLAKESIVEECCKKEILSGVAEGFHAHVFKNKIDGTESLALTFGWEKIEQKKIPLIRVLSGCLWEEAFGLGGAETSLRKSLEIIRNEGCGALLYIREQEKNLQEIFCSPNSCECRSMSEESINNIPPDTRLYGIGAQCLRFLGVSKMNLLTDCPKKRVALEGFGLQIVSHLAIGTNKD